MINLMFNYDTQNLVNIINAKSFDDNISFIPLDDVCKFRTQLLTVTAQILRETAGDIASAIHPALDWTYSKPSDLVHYDKDDTWFALFFTDGGDRQTVIKLRWILKNIFIDCVELQFNFRMIDPLPF